MRPSWKPLLNLFSTSASLMMVLGCGWEVKQREFAAYANAIHGSIKVGMNRSRQSS